MFEENKKILKVENEVVKKPTAPRVPRRSPIQPLLLEREHLAQTVLFCVNFARLFTGAMDFTIIMQPYILVRPVYCNDEEENYCRRKFVDISH